MNNTERSMMALAVGIVGAASSAVAALPASPALTVTRLTPPSLLFSTGSTSAPVVARFLPGQRFDLQATVAPTAGHTITNISFKVDGVPVAKPVALIDADNATLLNSKIGTARAYANNTPGTHTLTVVAKQDDGTSTTAVGSFSIEPITISGRKAKNVILMIGDGMGIAHRTAARLVSKGSNMGKTQGQLAMDTFPNTALVMTASLNSIVTDSAPGAACYSTGNKCFNGQEGVFPDDTKDEFDNPRVENAGEYLKRTKGASLGLVTTADVFDATPAAIAVHTQNRGSGTGICDQYLNEAPNTGLSVLMGGGRKWFLPAKTNGVTQATSARKIANDYILPAELAAGWGVANNVPNADRDLIGDFVGAGWTYVADNTSLNAVSPATTKLLGLFSYSNMNVSEDKLNGRRGINGPNGQPVVNDYLLPDQPMLEDMTAKAIDVLKKNDNGFFLMVEGASIDKQAHLMDSDRWIMDTIEFDKAVGVAKNFASTNLDTLVIVTADHECGGINVIGASLQTSANLANLVNNPTPSSNYYVSNGVNPVLTGYVNTPNASLRDSVVGTYDSAGFPVYSYDANGYPLTMDPDHKIIIGYAGGADRFETYSTYPTPSQDSQQPLVKTPPLNGYPATPALKNTTNGFFITGQVPGASGGYQAVHTASDIPLSAYGRGAALYSGVIDNTDVFFKAMQAVLGGATRP
ncbi:MAG TPA: alkaline phosphatase [Candidatus Limnocylindria bacterium]|jgi:alkaline phosphatase|nr:alkaline phosphatase [Candidatus Limnocylindria bacterium]